MDGKMIRVKIKDLKLRPIRQDHGTEDELKALAQSWLARPIHPIICRRDMTLAEGHRRVAGLQLRGETEVDVLIADEDLTDADLLEMGLASDVHRATVPFYDKCLAVQKLEEMNPGITAKGLADRLHVSAVQISRWKALYKCIPEVIEAARLGTLDASSVTAISQLPHDEQAGLLALRLSGAVTRDGLEKKVRERRAPQAPPEVKQGRVKCPLSTGVTVTVVGPDMTLTELIESLTLARDAAVKANKESLDIKTAMKVWADRAKAGA